MCRQILDSAGTTQQLTSKYQEVTRMNTVLKSTLVCVSLIALGLIFTHSGYTKIELADERYRGDMAL